MARAVQVLEEEGRVADTPTELSSVLVAPDWHAAGLQNGWERVMNGPARLFTRCVFPAIVVLTVPAGASAQMTLRPTPPPIVTAENETWYRTGEPLTYAGNLYYPAGPAIHFLADEMVRSGFYQGVPLYTRTTIEPYSVVFVPLGGGLMQPYERRRAGELAGTSGSTVPSLPIEIPSAVAAAGPIQAPAPPMLTSSPLPDESTTLPTPPEPRSVESRAVTPSPQPASHARSVSVGTTGRVTHSRPAASRVPRASNGIFVEYDRARWFSSGPPQSLDLRTLDRIGEWHGFPVYAAKGVDNTIYIPVAQGLDALAPYSKRH